ncbi:response regulator sensor, GAF domain-containing [Geotalea daltonii FRC-32]|uniref:Response regulator sensor, GAF domain-containing n=1 Tax=Geotalea daltonii (strain DSM 22248 / JCM 15807 / FRC-32) TaxID=316067 RepID=B9M5D7_GEODF|nr:response regulator [Geotalea daltonii]ACM19892.2 response regulator sensor, GAF domain-containing [Geotalea daltonii FRC-32]
MANFSPHILVVDDSPSFQKMVYGLLLKKGYRVTCASSGEEAVRLFRAEEFNMVLTDIMLPGMSGLNMLKLAKEMKPEIDVVIISSNASSFTAIKALRLGAYDYIVKPIDDEAILYNVVARTMEKQSLTVENRRLIRDLSEKNHALEETLQMMTTLNSACAALASTTDIGTILRKLVESAVAQLKAEKGYLLLLDKSGMKFSMKVCVGIDHNLAKTFSMQKDQGISGLVAADNKPLSIESDIPASLTVRLLEEDTCGDLFSTPGILSVPLQIKDRVVGVVNISGRPGGKMFTDTEVDFVTTLATYAAIALDNAGTCYRLRKNGI